MQPVDINQYAATLAAMPLKDQLEAASAVLSYEDKIVLHARLIESIYMTYLEKSRHCPEQSTVDRTFMEKLGEILE